ncbi:MAG: DUF3419 family protein [Saprospiraceae bacterium]
MGLWQRVSDRIFNQIHGKHLVYNACWEDPRCDRAVMSFGQGARIVMLTSAGCNALDYLLDDPAEIHCVDLNYRQNALLRLKIALFEAGSYDDLWAFFGEGGSPACADVYRQRLRPLMDAYPEAQAFWDKHIRYFSARGRRPSFYWRGSSGFLAWSMRGWLRRRRNAASALDAIFSARTLSDQQTAYNSLEPALLTPFARWFVGRHLVQSLAGVPKTQQDLAKARYKEGMIGYVRDCFRHVFTRIPIQDNYFWRVYYYGSYTRDCCPEYLRRENFKTLRTRVSRIQTYTCSLNDFLENHSAEYSHYVLLDHQDWLAAHLYDALETEWRLIFANSAPGVRILMRSASPTPDFLPDFALSNMVFDEKAAAFSAANDRVGTYAGVWVAAAGKDATAEAVSSQLFVPSVL